MKTIKHHIPRLAALFLALAVLPHEAARCQSLCLTPTGATHALYVNTDNLAIYNRYERLRLNASLTYVTPSEASAAYLQQEHQWRVNGYIGYGFGNNRWNYGGQAALLLKNSVSLTPYLSASNDMTPTARVRFEPYQMLNFASNSIYATNRYAERKQITLGATMSPNNRLFFDLSASHNRERYCFDSTGTPIYFTDVCATNYPYHTINEMQLAMRYTSRAYATLSVGRTSYGNNFMRLLGQYQRQWATAAGGIKLTTQGGFATKGATYSRLFDISGSCGSPLAFDNTFATIRPNEFHANLFVKASATLTWPRPLWQTRFTSPMLYAQLSGEIGWLNSNGLGHTAQYDGIALESPNLGILEPAIGVKRLLTLGQVEMGVHLAYRLAPSSAAYHLTGFASNFAIGLNLSLTQQ